MHRMSNDHVLYVFGMPSKWLQDGMLVCGGL